jgi:chromosome segregation ATPase
MSKNPIDKLEELIPKLVDETRQLREDNQRLQKEIITFRTDLERAQKNGASLQSKVERLGKLETVQKQLEKDQNKIRSTVKNLLAGIEKIGNSS